jgi:phosphoribosylformylglycinamidine synthase
MLIGLGGGAASSVGSGQSSSDLDFASVQRGNAEMQRRAQEVIDRCWAMGERNPILLIHDVGAGGLSNALPEAIAHSQRGGRIDLRRIPERRARALADGDLVQRGAGALRARAAAGKHSRIRGAVRARALPLRGGRRDHRRRALARDRSAAADDAGRHADRGLAGQGAAHGPRRAIAAENVAPLSTAGTTIAESLQRLLRLPTIADKSFLITIGDRTVGGLISRDQMVGPWQVPVADVAVTLSSFRRLHRRGHGDGRTCAGGRAGCAGVRPARGRRGHHQYLAADVRCLTDVRLSANWMAACGQPGEDADLYATVRAVGIDLCAELGITIPVGKDSLSMRTAWTDADGAHSVVAPISLIVSAFAPVRDARRTLTPELDLSQPSRLCSSIWAAARIDWADPAGRRCSARRRRAGRSRLGAIARALVRRDASNSRTAIWCSPITTVRTAVC